MPVLCFGVTSLITRSRSGLSVRWCYFLIGILAISEAYISESSQLSDQPTDDTVVRVLKSHSITRLESSRSKFQSRQRRSVPTSSEITTIVDLHNELRRQETGASNMMFMTWNAELATMADLWSQLCNFQHGQPSVSFTPPYSPIGQNIWASTVSNVNVTEATYNWYDEKQYYTFSNGACSQGECGHYTQMVWATSMQVGCGYTTCPTLQLDAYSSPTQSSWNNAGFFVCNYGPAGNLVINGIPQKPYLLGPPCTACNSGSAWCNQGLCMCGCTGSSSTCSCSISCAHCGVIDPPSCSCRCQPGFTGAACNSQCQDLNAYCGANPGWPASSCNVTTAFSTSTQTAAQTAANSQSQCPALCGSCVRWNNNSAAMACSGSSVPGPSSAAQTYAQLCSVGAAPPTSSCSRLENPRLFITTALLVFFVSSFV